MILIYQRTRNEMSYSIIEGKNNMSEEHKMTAKDKLVLGITLAAIFLGVCGSRPL